MLASVSAATTGVAAESEGAQRKEERYASFGSTVEYAAKPSTSPGRKECAAVSADQGNGRDLAERHVKKVGA